MWSATISSFLRSKRFYVPKQILLPRVTTTIKVLASNSLEQKMQKSKHGIHLKTKCMQLHTQSEKMRNLLKEKNPSSSLFWPQVPALVQNKLWTTSFLYPSPDVPQVVFNFPAVSLRAVFARQVLQAAVSFSYTQHLFLILLYILKSMAMSRQEGGQLTGKSVQLGRGREHEGRIFLPLCKFIPIFYFYINLF